jgi:TnpA family transposase
MFLAPSDRRMTVTERLAQSRACAEGGALACNWREGREVEKLTMHVLESCLAYLNALMIQRLVDESNCREPTSGVDAE